MKKKPLIYVAGPYTNKDIYKQRNNIDIAEQYGRAIARAGLHVYVPHVATKNWNDVNNYQYFMDLHMRILENSTDIFLLPNWEHSKGTKIEHKYAKKNGIYIWEHSQLEDMIYNCNKRK